MRYRENSPIIPRYKDALGQWRRVSNETRSAILEMIGEPSPQAKPLLVMRRGQSRRLSGRAELILEDSTTLRLNGFLPPDLPLGYHTVWEDSRGVATRLIVTPRSCYLPEDLWAWGWSVQLYALRSSQSWGIGDFADLRQLASWSGGELGAQIILVNPLCASTPVMPQQSSPYFPSSRSHLNLLYLRIEEIPGVPEFRLDLEALANAGKALNNNRRVDRDAVFKLKMEALEQIWSRFGGDPAFDRFCNEQGASLKQFATFCALTEHCGGGWPGWRAEYRHPESAAVARFAADRADRVRFYKWVQWLLDRQLADASGKTGLMQDLPIGVDPGGADAWTWQDLLTFRAAIGSPPDQYNTQGQNWGLPPFIPWKLRNAGYEPFVQTIRAVLRHAGGLRIDHVMGLFRLFWVPQGAEPKSGTYVRYPAEELLAILALESERAKATIVGEDLGTVEESARQQLAKWRVLSYRLLWFEKDSPSQYPKLALTAVTTHDLPTIAGLWTGYDLEVQKQLNLQPNEEGTRAIRERLSLMAGIAKETPIEEVISRTYELLAQAPSVVVTATIEDAMAVVERPNMPGAAEGSYPSWSLALPLSLEDFKHSGLVGSIVKPLNRRQKAQQSFE